MKNLSVITKGNMCDLPLAVNYADAADNLVSVIDLSVQKDSYNQFINEIIPYYMYGKGYSSKYNVTKTSEITNGLSVIIEFDSWSVRPSVHTTDWCKKKHTSLEAELVANARVQVRNLTEHGESVAPHERYMEVLVTKFPMLTPSGSLIINGVEKILTSHLEPACKVRLEVLDKKGSKGDKILKFITASRVFNTGKMGTNASNSQIVIKQGKIGNSTNPVYTISVGQPINNFQLIDFLKAISADVMKESFMREVLGVSQQLLAAMDSLGHNSAKQRSELEIMEDFELRFTERQNLNERLSYEKRATGRILALDIPELGLKSGHILTKDDAIEAQFLGCAIYVYPKTGIGLNLRIFSNNFVSADVLFDHYQNLGKNITQPEAFKGKMVHLPTFQALLEKNATENIDLNTLIRLNYAELIGRNLLVDDVLALVNLYGAFLSNDEKEDDIDSLSIKSITNISEIYEEIFSAKFRINGDGYLPEKFVNALNRAKSKGNSDKESYYSNSVIDISCEDRQTITAKLGTCSLLDQADTAGPLSEVNHRRKVSLKKVEGRGGTDSQTSIRKPRSVNPSMVTRLDLVESPEGANIGLIRYLTATAAVNASGDIESPWLIVDGQAKRIVYNRAFYLNYDREMDLIRAVGASIGKRDCVKIKIYGLQPKYRDMHFEPNQTINIEDLPWEDDTQWCVIEEQTYPTSYTESIVENTTGKTTAYVTEEYRNKSEKLSDLNSNKKGSYDTGNDINYTSLAENLMRQYGGYKYELDFERENWFNKQKVVVYTYNPVTKEYKFTETKQPINCYSGHGDIVSVNAEDIDIVSLSDEHIFSPVGSSVPFSAYDDLTRKMMGSAHNKSAEPLLHGTAPTITTKIAKKSAEMATGVIKSPVSGKITFVDSSKVVIQDELTNTPVTVPLVTGFKSVIKTMIISVPAVKLGDKVEIGGLLADSNMTKNGDVAHGVEILGGYMPFEGYNYEDGILLSDRLIRESILTSPHFKTCTQRLTGHKAKGRNGNEIFTPIQTYKATQEKIEQMQHGRDSRNSKIVLERDRFDDDYLIKPGLVVSTGDTLAYYISETVSSDSDNRTDSRHAAGNIKIKLNSLIYKDAETGVIISSEFIVIKGEEHIQIVVGHEEAVYVGDKFSGRHGNKGVCSKILRAADMPRLPDGRSLDIVLSPLGVPSRMNIGQTFEGQLNPVLKHYNLTAETSATERFSAQDFVKLMCEFNQDSNGELTIMNEEGVIVDRFITEFNDAKTFKTKVLEPGKYSVYPYRNQHDIYSIKVDNKEIMDFKGIRDTAVDYKIQEPAYINESLNIICYGKRTFELIYDRQRLAQNSVSDYALRFNANGNDEQYCLEVFLEESGVIEINSAVSKCTEDKVQLYDGRTGEPYTLKTNFIISMFIKHKHQVSEKIAARSAGTFYNNYDQPPHGKERDGGQKLGAMELWSLAESGCVNTVEEFMTYKSDDAHGRQRFAAYLNEERKKSNRNPSALAQYGPISNLDLEVALGAKETNAPFVTKKITALLAASFLDLKYFNKDMDELHIYEDAFKGTSGDNANIELVGARVKTDFIEDAKETVHGLHSSVVRGGKDVNSFNKAGGYKTTGDDYYGARTLAPEEAEWSPEYFIYGGGHHKTTSEINGGVEGTEAVTIIENVNLATILSTEDMDSGMEFDEDDEAGTITEEVSIFNASEPADNIEYYDNNMTDSLKSVIVEDTEGSLDNNRVTVPLDIITSVPGVRVDNDDGYLDEEDNDAEMDADEEEETSNN